MDLITDLTEKDVITEATDLQYSKDIGDTLVRAYPGYGWLVHVNSVQGVVTIKLMEVATVIGKQYCMVLHLSNLNFAKSRTKKVLWAGGEMLERAGLTRNRKTEYDNEVKWVEGLPSSDQPLLFDK